MKIPADVLQQSENVRSGEGARSFSWNPFFHSARGVSHEAIFPSMGEFELMDDSQLKLCYTCWSCAVECPVNRFTSRLNPARLLRMAHLGLVDELLEGPAIWYCLACDRCSRICPMRVKPSVLIARLRYKAVERGVVPRRFPGLLRDLNRRFQRLRRKTMSSCLDGPLFPEPQDDWDAPPSDDSQETDSLSAIMVPELSDQAAFRKEADRHLGVPTRSRLCYTCSQCSNACPVCFERDVFDPLRFIRLANLGLRRLALSSPSLWLCIRCESCTHACPVGVKGHLVMDQLQNMALQDKVVAGDALSAWHHAQKRLYSGFLDRIDGLLTAESGIGSWRGTSH